MSGDEQGWKVIDQDAGVMVREYAFIKGAHANCFTAKMGSGDMMVMSPSTGIKDSELETVTSIGKVGAVVANNGYHHLGQADWRKSAADAQFFAAPEAAARIKKQQPGAGEFAPLDALGEMLGDDVGVRASPATKAGETWAWAKIDGGYAWYGSDVFCNWDKFPGNFVIGALWRITGSGPGFKLFHLAMMATTKDKKVMLRQLLSDLEAHPPTVLVPAHGPLLDHDGLADDAIALVRNVVG